MDINCWALEETNPEQPEVLGRCCSKSQERKIPLVPENVLKKRKASQALRVTQAKEELLQRKERRTEKELKYKQLEWLLHNSCHQLHDRV